MQYVSLEDRRFFSSSDVCPQAGGRKRATQYRLILLTSVRRLNYSFAPGGFALSLSRRRRRRRNIVFFFVFTKP